MYIVSSGVNHIDALLTSYSNLFSVGPLVSGHSGRGTAKDGRYGTQYRKVGRNEY